jgi:hypothetical protein
VLEYGFEAGIQTMLVLEAAAGFIPVPFAKQLVSVALTLIYTCEVSMSSCLHVYNNQLHNQEVTVLKEQIRDVTNRICGIMLVIVNAVQEKQPDDFPNNIEKEVKILQSYVILSAGCAPLSLTNHVSLSQLQQARDGHQRSERCPRSKSFVEFRFQKPQ